VREFWLVVNYANEELGRKLILEGLKCITGTCTMEGTVEDVPIEEGGRFWSDPASWPSGVLPGEEEDVVIEPGWNMYLDLE